VTLVPASPPGNVIQHGGIYDVNLYYFSAKYLADESLWFPVRVKGFGRWLDDGGQNVRVEAVEPFDYGDNEWTVPFKALRRRS
jgi:hypothetical protein